MAAIKATITDISQNGDGSAMKVLWTAVTEADTFAAVYMPGYVARSLQIGGTFGSATVVLNGSNDGTNYAGLHDSQGVAISKTSAALAQVQESVMDYQPAASGGSSQSLTVIMLFVNTRRFGG